MIPFPSLILMKEQPLPVSTLGSVTDHSFEMDVLKASSPVLVDFWAPWCGPCQNLMPTLEAIALEYTGKVTILKLNVDDNPQTAAKYGVRGIPTLILFKGAEPAATCVGALSKTKLSEFLDANA